MEAGIVYMAEGFTVETTKHIILIIEKIYYFKVKTQKELTLIINSPGGSVMRHLH